MKVGVLGLGLIGGSMARAYALDGHTVFACEKDRDILSFAILAESMVPLRPLESVITSTSSPAALF